MDCNDFMEAIRKETDILEHINDFEAVRDRLSVRIMNTEIHAEKLADMAAVPFLDLSATFAIILLESTDYRGMIRVSKELADSWEVGYDEILQAALANDLDKGEFRMECLSQTLKSLAGEDSELSKELERLEGMGGQSMYIICEKSMRNGSAAILMNSLLREYSYMLDSDLIILPSSTSELICIEDSLDRDYCWLKTIVKEVNDNVVTEDELLSYSVYKYSRQDDRVSIVA